MSTYCKAYSLAKLRQFPDWTENGENARKEVKDENGKPVEITRKLTDDDFLYIHDSLVVTDGIFEDQNIIFNNITPEWETFCQETLKFQIPDYARNENAEKK